MTRMYTLYYTLQMELLTIAMIVALRQSLTIAAIFVIQ